MVGAHQVHGATLDHRDGLPPGPDIFADQRAGGLVVFRDPAARDDRVREDTFN